MYAPQQRKIYIDVLRGAVMIIMLLDHVRDFFHNSAIDPMEATETYPALYLTRWITHFCAPVFIFLSGVSAFLQIQKYGASSTARFLVKRGLWLIIMECTVVAFAWTFDPLLHFIPFQVIWAIGISMLICGLLLFAGLKVRSLLVLGLVIIVLHNLLDTWEKAQSGLLIDLLHRGGFTAYHYLQNRVVVIVYPFLPWTGVMLMGIGMGGVFSSGYGEAARRKLMWEISAVFFSVFFALRVSHLYGDKQDWRSYGQFSQTLYSFFDVCKYPPSLLYICLTLGPAFFILPLLEKSNSWFSKVLSVYGRTAFFFYVLHILLVHTVAMVFYFSRGHSFSEASSLSQNSPFLFVVAGEGFSLGGVYLVWLGIAVALYPLCYWYDLYRRAHPQKSWLRYL